MLTSEQFLKHLRDDLSHLYEPERLRRSPLAALFGVANRFDTPSALRRILVDAIESLDPGPNESTSSRAWQTYAALLYRYVERLGQHEVADQLGMSVRHLRRKEHEAMQVLADCLWEQYDLDVTQTLDLPAAGVDEAPNGESAVKKELTWLKEAQQWGPADLGRVLPGVLDLARGLADRHRATLTIAVANGLPHVATDPTAVRHSLLNLLSVAIPRATDGRVSISIKPDGWDVEFRVMCPDYPTGPKPPLADETASLSLAQQLAALGGGQLHLAVDTRVFDARLTFPAIEQTPILLVDDNVETHQLLQRYVTGTPYRLVAVREAGQALKLARELSPQAIILDVMMPGVDGWDILAQLRQDPPTMHVPVIVCTILAQKELALHLGANAFLRKPITRQAFLAVLDQQVQRGEREVR